MPSLTIRDIPDDLHAKLKAEAEAHGRSLNREILLRLKVSVDRRQPPVDAVVESLRTPRRKKGLEVSR